MRKLRCRKVQRLTKVIARGGRDANIGSLAQVVFTTSVSLGGKVMAH